MKPALIIGLLTIFLAALFIAFRAFIFVFSTVFYWGLIALVLALVIYVVYDHSGGPKGPKLT